ncbi:MAG: ribosome silencing factor [Xanthomonadales bacterium]|nr:ribosome silencing factor [Xanthomonadales bacterium]
MRSDRSLRPAARRDKINPGPQGESLLTTQTADVPTTDELRQLVLSALEDFKAIDVQVIDVSEQNPLTDFFVIASGNSSRHIKSMAENLVIKAKAAGCQPLGIEGQQQAEWVLVDLNDVIVHLMLPQTRAFYNLEKLWELSKDRRNGVRQPT